MWNLHLELAPERGLIIAYLPTRLVFEPYAIVDGRLVFEGSEKLAAIEPAECHLFDTERELRMVRRKARGDVVELTLTRQEEDAMEPDLVYVEEPLVRGELAARPGIPGRIRVVNRYAFTEDDTLVLKNYRISLVEEEDA